MTLRTLPEIKAPEAPRNLGFDIEPRALAAWDPNVAAADGGGDVTISILDYIGENWDGTGVTSRTVATALRSAGANPVTVLINSPGGNFFEGLAIYNLLRAHPAAVTVQIIGIAASAASFVAMAGDTIQIAKAGMMMVHNTQWVAVGDRHDMQSTFETMVVFDETLRDLYADRTGTAAAEVAAMMDATTFMSGTNAIERGFADELLPADRVTTGATNSGAAAQPAAYRLEAVLAKAGVSRTERRKLLREITGGKPGAATGDDMPCAVEPTAASNGGTRDLGLALARLRLARFPT